MSLLQLVLSAFRDGNPERLWASIARGGNFIALWIYECIYSNRKKGRVNFCHFLIYKQIIYDFFHLLGGLGAKPTVCSSSPGGLKNFNLALQSSKGRDDAS